MTAPEKLKMKVGDIKVPIMKELNIVRKMAICRAYLKPRVTKATKVNMLASPRRSPGMGWGIKDSDICITQDMETRRATLYILEFSLDSIIAFPCQINKPLHPEAVVLTTQFQSPLYWGHTR
jgi:hypothetical protein